MTGTRGHPDIVHVVCGDGFAGVERYIVTLARVQHERGSDVRVLGGDHRRMPAELSGTAVRWAPADTPWQAAHELRRLGRVGLVHAHMTAAELAAVVATRGPVVSTRHFASTRGASAAGRAAGRYIGPRLAGQVAISAFVAGIVEGSSTVIHPGVPVVADTPEPRAPVVLMAQRLEIEKRTDLGLRIWAASGLAAHGWQLLIAGSGALKEDLIRLAESLGIEESCEFLGARPDVADLMATAAVFLAPRPDEPYGLSVVEAMAHGTPIVAAEGGGHDETVGTSPHAVMVSADDPETGGARLAELALDGVRRDAYGAELRDLQRSRFSVERHVDRLDAFYNAAIR
jgi:glycosyltransferase involved in cell wall biosynthesis